MRQANSIARLVVCIALVGLGGIAVADDNRYSFHRQVFVPAPTGVPEIDWENIQQAVDRAKKGDTVRFRRGVYVLGADSDFIVVRAPGVHLKGHRRGTTIVGGEVLPTTGEVGSPYLMGNNSLLQSPPRGFRLTADEQRISRIRFKSFRTAVFVGFGDSAQTGGYMIKNCRFVNTMYGIQAHVESDEVTDIRGNAFINNTFPYDISGGKYHVSYNYVATPKPNKVPIDDFTHHAGDIAAGGPFYEEGGAFLSENNVFEFNVVDGSAEGIQVIGDLGGVVRNNIFRNNAYRDMRVCPSWPFGDCFGTFAAVLSFGGDIVDNVWVNNVLNGTEGVPFTLSNFGGLADGNLIVSNKLRSIANVSELLSGFGSIWLGATNTVVLDNVFTGNGSGALEFGAGFVGGSFNQYLLNVTDANIGALYVDSPNGLFASDDPTDIAVDQFGNLVASLDSNQDFSELVGCAEVLADAETGDGDDDDRDDDDDDDDDELDVSQLVVKFRSCVDEAVGELL